MDERGTTELLNELHAKLKNAEAISERDRELLTRLSVDIESLLAQGGHKAENHRSVIDRLQESIARFEASHPDLTNLMGRVVQKLADMGI